MEKFHKYCLGVLMVIICSNISAQINSGHAESEDCKRLYEIYNQILVHDENSPKFCTKANSGSDFTINQKHKVVDAIGNIFPSKGQKQSQFDTADLSTFRHHELLKNFEKNKDNFFAKVSYLKIKISKIRNKDYLENIS